MHLSLLRRTLVLAAALSVGITGIAGAATKSTKATPKVAKAAKAAAPSTFPSVKVIDLATSKSVDLASFNVTTKPQLVWFWAPT